MKGDKTIKSNKKGVKKKAKKWDENSIKTGHEQAKKCKIKGK